MRRIFPSEHFERRSRTEIGFSNRPHELTGHPDWERAFDLANRWVFEKLSTAREGTTWDWKVIAAAKSGEPELELKVGYGDSFLTERFAVADLKSEWPFKDRVGGIWMRFVNYKIHETEVQIQRLLRELKEESVGANN